MALLLQTTEWDRIVAGEFGLILLIVSLVFFGLWVWSIVWAYRDAEKHGKSGVLVALLVAFLSWPLGLLAWVIFRPDAPHEPAQR